MSITYIVIYFISVWDSAYIDFIRYIFYICELARLSHHAHNTFLRPLRPNAISHADLSAIYLYLCFLHMRLAEAVLRKKSRKETEWGRDVRDVRENRAARLVFD